MYMKLTLIFLARIHDSLGISHKNKDKRYRCKKTKKQTPLTTVEDEKISSDRISFEVFGH